MRLARVAAGVLVVLVVGAAGFLAYAWHPAIAAIDPPAATSFDHATIQRGAQLAALGNCNSCHSAPDGKPYSGGLGIQTPFGVIYSSNITPDPETGIGRWSEAAFRRSMRQGLGRNGEHLYPAFPYNHFTLVSDEDDHAIYAYLMTRQRVRYTPPANELPFPLNVRLVLAGWKLLFFHEGTFAPDPTHDVAWNHGAYLAEGLEHCGACHTPHNALGAEVGDNHWGGGEAEGWHSPALNKASPSPIPWEQAALTAYLREGWQEVHGVARGPMSEVTANLGSIPKQDVEAIAAYTMTQMGDPGPEKRAKAKALLAATQPRGPGAAAPAGDSQTQPQAFPVSAPGSAGVPDDAVHASVARGAAIYAGACATCHAAGRPLPYGGLNLALSSALYQPNPHNIINVVLHGLPAAEGERSPVMPGFAGAINDAQVADLLAYARATFSDKPAWTDIERQVREARTGARPVVTYQSAGDSAAPANVSQQPKPW